MDFPFFCADAVSTLFIKVRIVLKGIKLFIKNGLLYKSSDGIANAFLTKLNLKVCTGKLSIFSENKLIGFTKKPFNLLQIFYDCFSLMRPKILEVLSCSFRFLHSNFCTDKHLSFIALYYFPPIDRFLRSS